MRLENKTTIVADTGHGLGRGIALKLAAEGAKVIVAGMSMETATATTGEINASGDAAKTFAVSIAKQDGVKTMMDFTVEPFSALDVIVNNARVNRGAMLHKMVAEQWDQAIVVSLTGTFHCIQYAAQTMREKGSGAIVSISSTSWLGNIGQTSYAASKAGVVGLTKTACRELAREGVTCNTICPGFIDTDMTRDVPEKVWDTAINKTPMRRTGSPANVASMAIFLASDKADYVTGGVINVSGGMVL